MKTRNVLLVAGLLTSLVCGGSWGSECRFFRITCVEGGAPENLAITSDEFGEIFLEFDTEDQRTYVIETTDSLSAAPAWATVSSITGDGQRVTWPTMQRWSRTFGGKYHDWSYSACQTSNGGYIVAGYTESFGAGSYDVYLVKTDAEGNEIWSRTFGGRGSDSGYCVQQTCDGGYIVAGHTESFGAGNRDVYLIKTDQSGNEVWSTTFGGSDSDWAKSVQETSDGGYIVAGETLSFGAGNWDVYLVKTNQSGNEVWSKAFGGDGADGCYSVQQTSEGGYIVAGWTLSFGAAGEDVYVIKTDQNGNEQWSKTFGGDGYDEGYSVQQTSDGGYIVAGTIQSSGAGSWDAYLIKTDQNGDEVWSKTFGGSQGEYGRSVRETRDGGYIVAGDTLSFGAGRDDVYLIKTDSDGNEVWSETFGGIDVDHGYSVQETTDGGYIVAGSTYSFDAGSSDVYLIKTDQNGNSPCDLRDNGAPSIPAQRKAS